VAPLFDTQIAAQLLMGAEQIAFGQLVQQIVGHQPAKGHSYSQWDRRPLSPGQIEYALDDVRLLAPVYAAQQEELAERQRDGWAREEFARLEDPARFQDRDPEEQYRRVKGFNRLRGEALAALRELAAWREETARERDRPVQHIVRDEVLVEVARHPVSSVDALRDIRGLHQDVLRRHGEELLEAARRGRELPPPHRETRLPLDNALEPTVDTSSSACHARPGSRPRPHARWRPERLVERSVWRRADVPLPGLAPAAVGERLLGTMDGRATCGSARHALVSCLARRGVDRPARRTERTVLGPALRGPHSLQLLAARPCPDGAPTRG